MYLENTTASQKHDKLRNGDHTPLASRISQLGLSQSKLPDGEKQTSDLFNNQYTHENVIVNISVFQMGEWNISSGKKQPVFRPRPLSLS